LLYIKNETFNWFKDAFGGGFDYGILPKANFTENTPDYKKMLLYAKALEAQSTVIFFFVFVNLWFCLSKSINLYFLSNFKLFY